jgi:hypothetical protein
MAGLFLTKSRHGSIYYFRRRVPEAAQVAIGRKVFVQSLATSDRRLAVIRARVLAALTDLIFHDMTMAKKTDDSDHILTEYIMKLELNDFGKPTSLHIDAEPHEQEAVNSAIRAALESVQGQGQRQGNMQAAPTAQKPFSDAIQEYFTKAKIKPQTKATYRSKFDHACKFFGSLKNVLDIDQADFVNYCEHVLDTVPNSTSQSHYMTTVATLLNWFRVRTAGLPPLTTKTLVPKRDTPEADDRDAFTLEQLGLIFSNANLYRASNPHKFWVSIAPVFLGCRIEELCQIQLATDLVHDKTVGVWYLVFDGRPDLDGTVRKSMKVVSSWRHIPIHASLVRHGFIDFLQNQLKAGFQRPFQKEWKPREVKSNVGQIVKWSHYISRWGGRELDAVAERYKFDATQLTYFHSMRHTFKQVLGNAGVSSEISEALSGRRYGGADAERYEKLKQNHHRLFVEGIDRGLDSIAAILNKVLKIET